jgi:cell division protease FtsH
LDKALLRPGRFDRQVNVGLPDVRGREQILNVHIKKVPAADDVKLYDIARGTPGFSGADLANVVNEAALLAARSNKTQVSMNELEKAKDKILMGAERHTMVMTEEDKLLTAYHEAGHCIVGQLSPDHDAVYKVSIMPRGRALGITMFLPERDQYSASKRKLESQIASLFGGRIAELMIYGGDRVTTGASNDIERATELARNMVTRWGFSDKLGPLVYGEEGGQAFMGYPGSKGSSVSSNVAHLIDDEIREVIDCNYQRAEKLLQDNISILHKMADALMKWETIDRAQIDDLMAGKEPKAPVEDIILPAVEVFESNNEQQDIADNKSESITKKPAKQV